jgi:hypothetical protein
VKGERLRGRGWGGVMIELAGRLSELIVVAWNRKSMQNHKETSLHCSEVHHTLLQFLRAGRSSGDQGVYRVLSPRSAENCKEMLRVGEQFYG